MSRPEAPPSFSRRLGPFDATMIVMGGIIGSGIFMNPSVVARYVHTPFLIYAAWIFGGLIALCGAFIYAELAVRRPKIAGQYAYLRDAYHPVIAFMFAWSLLLVSNTGGMAAVAMTFARYTIQLTHIPLSDTLVAVIVLTLLTVINCFGVRAGANVQNSLMVIKILAIVMLIFAGYFFIPASVISQNSYTLQSSDYNFISMFGAAMVPVLFAYGGWQTSTFVAGEIKDPRKHLPMGLIVGVIGVVTCYLAVNFVCVRALGADGLANTKTPASEVMRMAFGERGANLIAIGIAISTLGFLSQCMLVAPRVYFAMADDGLFFKSVATLHPKTNVPVMGIIAQGVLAIAIALSNKYEEILNYVVLDDFLFFGLTAACIFIFRRADAEDALANKTYQTPGHPITTIFFIIVCIFIVINTLYTSPVYGTLSFAVILSGLPMYYFWKWLRRKNG